MRLRGLGGWLSYPVLVARAEVTLHEEGACCEAEKILRAFYTEGGARRRRRLLPRYRLCVPQRRLPERRRQEGKQRRHDPPHDVGGERAENRSGNADTLLAASSSPMFAFL